ncbi:MAG: SRPBCC domain-containing protein [Burkholderiaceae bacterium]
MNAPERFTLDMTRFIRAPRDKVFDAFTTQAGLASWMGPRGMQVRSASVDNRVGDAWRVEMHNREGFSLMVGGHFKELQRPSRIVFSWMWEGETSPMPHLETLIEVSLHEKDGGTELRMRHSGFPAAAAREGHRQGWVSTFNRLSDALDPRGSAGTLTLLGDLRSSYTRTARMALAEKGVAFTMQECAPHSSDIRAVHPFGRIPALRDGEITIWETAAIVNYIDECFDGGVSLRPSSILARTRCAQWISAVNSYLYDTMIRRYLLQVIFPRGPQGTPDHAVIDAALGEIPAQLAALEQAYAGSDYLAGPAVSAADLFVAPVLAGLQSMPEGSQLLAACPNVLRAQHLMRQRPSFTSTAPPRAS